MKRHPDARRASQPPTLCKYDPQESSDQRHDRRLDTALRPKSVAILRQWAGRQGLTLKVCNQGQHWVIRGKHIAADWWPRSAKLVINSRWEDGIHAHDVGQVIAELKAELEVS